MTTSVNHICARCSSREATFRKMDKFKSENNKLHVVQPYVIFCNACGHPEDFWIALDVERADDWGDGNPAIELL